MIRAGKLRHSLVLQSLSANSPERDTGGAPDESWGTVATVNASIDPLRGRELLSAQQQAGAEVSSIIKIRYRAGVTAGMRLRNADSSKFYDIVYVIDPEERHVELHLYVREGGNSG